MLTRHTGVLQYLYFLCVAIFPFLSLNVRNFEKYFGQRFINYLCLGVFCVFHVSHTRLSLKCRKLGLILCIVTLSLESQVTSMD
jgi:hypothetical protein